MPKFFNRIFEAILIAGVVILLPVLVVVGLVAYPFGLLYRWHLRATFRRRHPGKDLLLVYSNSPKWQQYVETEWFPRWGSRAVVLNWSERQAWIKSWRIEARLFRAYRGEEFNPVAIVVRTGPVAPVIVRFFKPFQALKHGKPKKLRDAEHELQAALDRNLR